MFDCIKVFKYVNSWEGCELVYVVVGIVDYICLLEIFVNNI